MARSRSFSVPIGRTVRRVTGATLSRADDTPLRTERNKDVCIVRERE